MAVVSTLSKIWGKLSSAAKFAAHYSDELQGITAVMRRIVASLPLGRKEKADIESVLAKLDSAALNIEEFLLNGGDVTGKPVTIKASDVKKAVTEWLEENPQAIVDAAAKLNLIVYSPNTGAAAGEGEEKSEGENGQS